MKNNIFTLLFILISSFVFSQGQDLFKDLQKKNDGKYYLKSENELYSGKVFAKHKNGKIGLQGNLKDGVFDGHWTWWYDDGAKKRETNYVNGKKEGISYWWHKNGVKKSEIQFHDNRNISQKRWDKNGNKLRNPRMGRA